MEEFATRVESSRPPPVITKVAIPQSLVAEVMTPNLWAFSHRESRVGVVMHVTVRLGETQFMVHCLPPRDTDRSGGKGVVCAVKRRRVVVADKKEENLFVL